MKEIDLIIRNSTH